MNEGRGQLSSIDLLPPEADPDVLWASQELMARKRTQADILFELNDRLAVIGCDPISKSAFNRYSTRKAALTRRLAETRIIAKTVTEAIGPDGADEVTELAVQLIKQAILEILEGGRANSKQLMELSRALNSALAAQKTSSDVRRNVEAEQNARLEKAAQTAADGIVKVAPQLDGAKVLKMIREAYGIGGQ